MRASSSFIKAEDSSEMQPTFSVVDESTKTRRARRKEDYAPGWSSSLRGEHGGVKVVESLNHHMARPGIGHCVGDQRNEALATLWNTEHPRRTASSGACVGQRLVVQAAIEPSDDDRYRNICVGVERRNCGLRSGGEGIVDNQSSVDTANRF